MATRYGTVAKTSSGDYAVYTLEPGAQEIEEHSGRHPNYRTARRFLDTHLQPPVRFVPTAVIRSILRERRTRRQ